MPEVADYRLAVFGREVHSLEGWYIRALARAVNPGGTVLVDVPVAVELFQLKTVAGRHLGVPTVG